MKFSTVQLSEIRADADLFRIDANYWRPDFIDNSRLVAKDCKISDVVSAEIANIKSSPVNRNFEYLEISRISTDSCAYDTATVEAGAEPDRAHFILQKGDVAISTVRPNRNAVAFVEEDGIVGSSGLSILRATGIEPEYLFVVCKTGYFIKCLVRANKATMYPAVSNDDVLNTPLFVASAQFRAAIAQAFKDSFSCLKNAQQKYIEGESVLLDELGLADWKPVQQISFVQNYSDIQTADRIDADYFQPKYAELVCQLESYSPGADKLGNLVELKDANFTPDPETEYKYIELANIARYGEIAGYTPGTGRDLPSRARRKIASGDVIVSSIEGSLQSIAIAQPEHDGALCSTGFYVIRSEKLNSETLLLLMRSMVGQLQLKKGCSGTILTCIQKEEFGKIVLPKVDHQVQQKLRQKITEAVDLRRQSKHLLDCAKLAVETAIEKGEKAALRRLEKIAGAR